MPGGFPLPPSKRRIGPATLRKLIAGGEGAAVEFKAFPPTPARFAKSFVAFANTGGGVIVIGVHDDLEIAGVDDPVATAGYVSEVAGFHCEPAVAVGGRVVVLDGMKILVVEVPESDRKPHRVLGVRLDKSVLVRVGATNRIASKSVVRSLREGVTHRAPRGKLDPNAVKLIDYLESHERITTAGFERLVNISKRRASRILVVLVRQGFVREHRLENEHYYTRG